MHLYPGQMYPPPLQLPTDLWNTTILNQFYPPPIDHRDLWNTTTPHIAECTHTKFRCTTPITTPN